MYLFFPLVFVKYVYLGLKPYDFCIDCNIFCCLYNTGTKHGDTQMVNNEGIPEVYQVRFIQMLVHEIS